MKPDLILTQVGSGVVDGALAHEEQELAKTLLPPEWLTGSDPIQQFQ